MVSGGILALMAFLGIYMRIFNKIKNIIPTDAAASVMCTKLAIKSLQQHFLAKNIALSMKKKLKSIKMAHKIAVIMQTDALFQSL